MKALATLCGLAVLIVACQRSVPVERVDEPAISVVDLVTTLGAEENKQLRARLGSLIVAASDESPSILMVLSELSSPAFNFHVESDCLTALGHVEDLLARAGVTGDQSRPVSELGCVEVGRRDVDEPAISVVNFVTTLGAEENEQLRDILGSLIVAATDDNPPILMVMSELSSPAFGFHVGSDCSTARGYVEDLLVRAGAGEGNSKAVPEIGCVEVGHRNRRQSDQSPQAVSLP